MTAKRLFWIVWYCLWYLFLRMTIIVDYIPRRLFNGWGLMLRKTGIVAGLLLSLAIVGLSLSGIPLLILWYLGRRTRFTHYRPMIERLHADFYAVG